MDNYIIYILFWIVVDGVEKYLIIFYIVCLSICYYFYFEEKDGFYWEDINGDGLIL